MSNTRFSLHCYTEHDQFITTGSEIQSLRSRANNTHIRRTRDRNTDISYMLFGSKNSCRNNHLFTHANHAWKRAKQHDRLTYKYTFLSITIRFSISGNNHNFDTAIIVWHCVDMTLLLASTKKERTFKLHNRLETIHN